MDTAAPTTPEQPATDLSAEETQPLNPNMRLFTLRVASNKEDRVKDALVRKTRIEGLDGKIGRILVPIEKKMQAKAGKRVSVENKKYPGYVFIEIEPDEHGRIPQEVWFMVKETEGVGDFIQASGKPHPMGRDEALRMIGESEKKEDPEVEVDYEVGDRIRVVMGVFAESEGEVEKILDAGKIGIVITVFGRSTSVEVTVDEIEKVS